MPTVGNTAKPANTQEFFGLNSTNQMATLITMPPGGPWLITELGAWIAGVNAGATVRICAWGPGGALIAQSDPFTAAGAAFGLGNSFQYHAAVPIQINGGDSIYVGWHRHSDHPVQNGRFSGGSHLHDTAGDVPESLSGFSTDSAGGLGAYVANYQALNNAPNAPTITVGTGVQHFGRTVLYGWQHNDPDGNPQLSAHWQLWNTAQTVMLDEDGTGNIGTSQSMWRTLPAGYNADSEYAWRVRTYDGSLWGPWSSFAIVRPNTPPNAPVINSPPTDTLTPTFTAGASDPDGNSIATMRYRVHRSTDSAQLWDSGEGSYTQVYAGAALQYGITYLVEGQVKDQWGAYSAWSPYVYWTPQNPVAGAPTLTPNTTATKQNTNTPNMTVAHASAFTDYEIEIYLPGGAGGVLQTVSVAPFAATTSKIAVPAALNWGQEYHSRARVLVGGVWSLWSGYSAMKINAEPTAPTVDMPGSIISPSGERVVTTLTPTYRAVFNDADKVPYGDAPTAASLEVRNNATDALVVTLTGTGESVVHSGTALAYGTTYKWRKRYTDNAGRQGPFSSYVVFRPTRAPTATLTAPAAASVVTDSTPTLDWAFSSLDGKAQYSFQVRINDKGPTGANYANPAPIYDSGERVSTDTAFTLPHGTLADDHDYSWTVTVKDTDGLTYVLT